jgi:prepilin-type N-terminal cleavage/methylation domain-containing protein
MKKADSGFTIVEMLFVAAIVLVVAAMAVPSIPVIMNNYRLTSSGHAAASLLQQARMAAVKNNIPYYVASNGCGGSTKIACAVPASRFTPPADNTNYVRNVDPTAAISGDVAFQTVAPANIKPLTDWLGVAPQAANATIAFNARGVPCLAPAGGTSAFLCQGPAPAFIWFMQSNSSQQWEAVTVTPSGRIRSWRQTSSGNWQ